MSLIKLSVCRESGFGSGFNLEARPARVNSTRRQSIQRMAPIPTEAREKMTAITRIRRLGWAWAW